MVYYRKYRPQTLDQLIGQEQIKQSLKKAYGNNRIASSYLFCGPKGTGKTSTARILAKMVNCEMGGESVDSSDARGPAAPVSQVRPRSLRSSAVDAREPSSASPLASKSSPALLIPCNSCSPCLSITDGSFMDLIEIDAASNRGIDDIRDIREKIKLSPTSGKKKVYIIDEVHMLSTEAFNALLKTLEEPPEHALFILATTEVHKIPETILSRVQRLDFKVATLSNLKKALKIVVDGENLKIEEAGLEIIAKKSSGSFRDGIKILDQLSSAGELITASMVTDSLKSSDFDHLIKLLKAMAAKDAKISLRLVLDQVSLGVNIKEYILSCLDILRSLLFIKNNLGGSIKEEWGSEKYEILDELEKGFDQEQLLLIINNFQEALESMKTASIVSLPLEIAIIKSAGKITRIKSLESREQAQDQPYGLSAASLVIPAKAGIHQILNQINNDNLDSIASLQNDKTSEIPETPTKDDIVVHASPAADLSTLKDKWNYILETIKPFNFSLEAMLKLVKILECAQDAVTLEVPYSFHQRIIDAPKSKTLLEGVLSDVLGRKVRVATVLGKRPIDREELANVEIAADDEVIKIASEIFNSDQIN